MLLKMKRVVLWLFIAAFAFAGVTFAQASSFVVTVSPNPLAQNEAGDLEIKVVDGQWNIVTDYQWNIFIEATSTNSTQDDVVLPWDDGIYEFTPEDQWQKVFSKGLIFKKDGEYKIQVMDILDESVVGETSTKVSAKAEATEAKWTVNVVSPAKWTTQSSSSLTVFANTNQPSTPYEIWIDSKKNTEWVSDENGDINATLDIKETGKHLLEVKLLSFEGASLGQSDKIDFSIEASKEDLLKGITILPSNTVIVGSDVSVTVQAASGVNSAVLVYSGKEYTLTKDAAGFKTLFKADTLGTHKLSLKLGVAGEVKNYDDAQTIQVIAATWSTMAVNEVKYILSGSRLNLEWAYTWAATQFQVEYGTAQQLLSGTFQTSVNTGYIEVTDMMATYYVQITPMDAAGATWTASSLIVIDLKAQWAATCKVQGIDVKTLREWENYYLVWNKVDGATKYIVYKSDTQVEGLDKMQKVTETTDTRFNYPFDPKASAETYAYYQVVAECADGVKVNVDGIKKVKVWPMDTLLVVLFLSSILYVGYRLYGYAK